MVGMKADTAINPASTRPVAPAAPAGIDRPAFLPTRPATRTGGHPIHEPATRPGDATFESATQHAADNRPSAGTGQEAATVNPTRPAAQAATKTGRKSATQPAAKDEESEPLNTGQKALLLIAGVLLVAVVVSPISLSSQDIIDWAQSPQGLGLAHGWAIVTFFSLDAAAAVCVAIKTFCAWRDKSSGGFGLLVWVFAFMSAIFNYLYGKVTPAKDDEYFFPLMSLAGPLLLEMAIALLKRMIQENGGKRSNHGVSFGMKRWLPIVGAPKETFGAWRLAHLSSIDVADVAVAEFRRLSPEGHLWGLLAKIRTDAIGRLDADDGPAAPPATGRKQNRPATSTGRPTGPSAQAATSPATRPVQGPADMSIRPATPTTPAAPNNPATRPATQPAAHRAHLVSVHEDRAPAGWTATGRANAAEIRRTFGLDAPTSVRQVRARMGWSESKAKPAYNAYLADADLAEEATG